MSSHDQHADDPQGHLDDQHGQHEQHRQHEQHGGRPTGTVTSQADAPPQAPQGSPVIATNPTYGHPPAPAGPYATQHVEPYATHGHLAGRAPVGRIRGTGACIALCIVTLGFYSLYWFYKTHQEMKRHSGEGIGGGIALLLAFFVGIVMPFLTSSEVGNLYRRSGMAQPVSGATGLWYFPGMFILIGPFVWFIKTNSALNSYWRSHGAA